MSRAPLPGDRKAGKAVPDQPFPLPKELPTQEQKIGRGKQLFFSRGSQQQLAGKGFQRHSGFFGLRSQGLLGRVWKISNGDRRHQ